MAKESQRDFPRIAVESLVSYLAVDRNKNILGQGIGKVINLSQGGVLLQTHAPIDAPYVLLALVDNNQKDLSFLGRVAHTQNSGSGTYNSGIKFIEKDEKKKQVVTSLVRSHSHQKNLR